MNGPQERRVQSGLWWARHWRAGRDWQGRGLAAPDLGEHAQPVLPHHLADLRFRPAGALHCRGEVRGFANGLDAREALDLAELGEPAGIAFVPGDPVEEPGV